MFGCQSDCLPAAALRRRHVAFVVVVVVSVSLPAKTFAAEMRIAAGFAAAAAAVGAEAAMQIVE